jgi:ATP-dependent DNA helicase DinG
MARLVARALRLDRSALLQVGGLSAYQGQYRLSYLIALLMWPGPAILVAPDPIQQQILRRDLPRLRDSLPLHKPIQVGDSWPHKGFTGLLLTTPNAWFADRLGPTQQFPRGVPTVIDDVDNLDTWVRQQLTVNIATPEWESLTLAFPDRQELIRDLRVALTHSAFQHPANPYDCYLVTEAERRSLGQLWTALTQVPLGSGPDAKTMPAIWQRFWPGLQSAEHLLWYTLDRARGQVKLHCSPVDLAPFLTSLWQQQPVVLIGASLDQDAKADTFRRAFGLEDLTCLKFSPHRQNDLIHLYLPDHLPLPNTPQFQAGVLLETRRLLTLVKPNLAGPTLILTDDLPLKQQLAATLAGEYGSRVQVERLTPNPDAILVSGWEFWHHHQDQTPAPGLLIIATLPLPSLEHPLVAGRVAYHKRRRQDWFRLYLFPTAVTQLQRAVAPVRANQGMVALLDTRVHYRSYGHQILDALSPSACSRSLQSGWELELES